MAVLVCIYKFTAFLHTLSYMYYSVRVVMIVAVRGCHPYLSKKFKSIVKMYFRLSIILLNGPHDRRK